MEYFNTSIKRNYVRGNAYIISIIRHLSHKHDSRTIIEIRSLTKYIIPSGNNDVVVLRFKLTNNLVSLASFNTI